MAKIRHDRVTLCRIHSWQATPTPTSAVPGVTARSTAFIGVTTLGLYLRKNLQPEKAGLQLSLHTTSARPTSCLLCSGPPTLSASLKQVFPKSLHKNSSYCNSSG